MGQGSSFPWPSSAKGRAAVGESFSGEVVGKGCCRAAMVAHKRNATTTLANSVARVIPHHQNCRNEYDRSSGQGRGVQSLAQQEGGQQYSEDRDQVERGGSRGHIKVLQRFKEKKHGRAIHEERQ